MNSSIDSAVKPFKQRLRIYTFRTFFVVSLPGAILIEPIFAETAIGTVLYQIGLILMFICVLGRIWSTLYVGKLKNVELVVDGPYSFVRNPLYFFSSIGALGFGLMLQSLVFTAAAYLGTVLIFYWTILHEEAFLNSKFGDEWEGYRAAIPRFWPNPSKFETRERVTWHAGSLRTNFGDAAVFISLVPLVAVIEWLRELVTFSVSLY